MEIKSFITIQNGGEPVALARIPVLTYDGFKGVMKDLLMDPDNHCALYFAFRDEKQIRMIACIARDLEHDLAVFSHEISDPQIGLESLAPELPQLQLFEREIHEQFGIIFENHPWMKPVRSPNQDIHIDSYPFYRMDGEELHEVGVGPIHAGVIEPGHFRFICHGEKVLHLEIMLGYQHRGIESLMSGRIPNLKRALLAEGIAGDTAVGHGLAHALLMESLSGNRVSGALDLQRSIGLELERIAVHIGDTAALCTDIAYQLGQVVNEALRTTIINSTQNWCGNRFGKGLVRPGGTRYPMTSEIAESILKVLEDTGSRFADMADVIYSSPTILARFDEIGKVTREQAAQIGAVGMSAKTCGIGRDIRKSHPFSSFDQLDFNPVVLDSGDVLARGMLRNLEIQQSIGIVKEWLRGREVLGKVKEPPSSLLLSPSSFSLALTEGWRGEICHSAITDGQGEIIHYKVKDPSFHNWMALQLAVRNQEISDFPVCNKSFNLSYCGHDL
jgi:Ni,Fe-hydrogenase III large subunit